MHSFFPAKRKQLCLIIATACASLAHASDGQSVEPLEQVVISATSYRTTGTKSDLKPMQAPMSYEVYDKDLLAARQVDSVNEALRYVPGVTPESRPTVTIFDQYTIRGFESYRNYYDGLPLQYNGLWNLVPQVDAFATESVEILKGPTSVLYGSAPPGGMVNQTAKLPRPEQETLVRARVGTNKLREVAVDSTGALSTNVDYRLVALVRDKDGQQVTTKESRRTFAPSLTWRISPDTQLNVSLYHQQDPDMIPSTPLPALGTLYRADYGYLDADAYAGDANWAGFKRDVTMAGWKLEHKFNDRVTFLQNFRHNDADGFQRNTYNLGLQADGRTLNRAAYFTDERQDGFVVDNQFAIKLDAAGVTHRLLVGADYQKLKSHVRYGDTLGQSTPAIDLGNPEYRLMNPATLPVGFYTERHNIGQTQLGFYLQDEVRLGALTLLGGVRSDRYKSTDAKESMYDIYPSSGVTGIAQHRSSGRVAAIYQLQNGFAPYVNYSTSFEPTSGVDSLTGSAFKPTTAEQLEAGIKFKSADNRTQLTAAYFDIKKQNVVVNTPTFNQYTQNGEVQSKGAELALRQRVTDNLDLTLGLTHLDMQVTKNTLNPSLVGKTPVWVAEKQASLWLNYVATPNLDLSAGVRYVGKSQMDAANSATVPSYTVVDAAANYKLDDTWHAGITASNLNNKRYVGACFDASNCWMGTERSVELSLNATF